ncbi:branched-chain amino acid ABC transporter substrate-binding protein [Candidatus Caldarchaeum subterraneum]|uniref:Branched-chain amino acid ABC transporter substrate-binding protein n=1 Tax=Caldiarchaeum subterraneum TaxID=311458 RepID=E6N4L8_CALS0|nr:branched-chain amino acid ABC transporter substrate-binding protein [Candidatus Caldarchaeum subterraneum]BAJ50097.1 branched-chain amino acid ABC transporter substrate-binding protein [Candidatus Caldarchaeum subterraneum]
MKRSVLVAIVAVVVVAAVAASAGFLFLSQQRLGASEVKIGALVPLTGPFAVYGSYTLDGMRFAVDELNARGGVLGARVVLVEADEKNDAKEAVAIFKRMAEVDRVTAVVGTISSGIGAVLSAEAEQAKVPLFLVAAGSHTILTKESRYTFRTCLPPAPTNGELLANFVRDKGYKRVGVVIASYEWGFAIRDVLDQRLKQLQGVQYQIEEAPLGETDFTTVLRKLQPLQPEVMILTGHPPGFPTITKQAIELGFQSAYYIASVQPPELMLRGVGDIGLGKLVTTTCVNSEAPEYKQLAEKFYQKYGKFFDHNAVTGYVTVMMIADAVEKTRSVDPVTVANHIRTSEYNSPIFAWPLSYTEWGEIKKPAMRLAVIKQGNPGSINPGANWVIETLYISPPVQPYVPEK